MHFFFRMPLKIFYFVEKKATMKKIEIKKASLFSKIGHLPYIGKYISGVINSSHLPIDVLVVDPETKEEFLCQLIAVLPFKNNIPEILSYHATGMHPSIATDIILQQTGTVSINQLAYYLYEHKK